MNITYLRTSLELLLAITGIAWLTNIPYHLNLDIPTTSYLLALTGIGVALGFLHKPYKSTAGKWEVFLVFLSLATWWWGAWNISDWTLTIVNQGPEKVIPGSLALLLLVEATRRNCGNGITGVVIACIVLGLFSGQLPSSLNLSGVTKTLYIHYLYTDTNGVAGVVLDVAATIVLAYLLFGMILSQVGASDFFTNIALILMGRKRGGPAKVAVCSSSLFGMISGSTVANVMTIGVITIPLMKKTGYPAREAAGIEAVASNGGQLAPPVMGTTAFLIAEFLQVPYAAVVKAAILPAIIYYIVLFLQVDFAARRLNLSGMPAETLPRFGDIGPRWLFVIPIVVLIFFLFVLGYPAVDSGLYAALSALICGCIIKKQISLKLIFNILIKTGQSFVILLLICAAAGIIIGTLNVTSAGFSLTNSLLAFGQNAGIFYLLLLTAVIAIILGMGMPTAAVYVVLSVLLSPALVRLGIDAMAANMFIFYFGLLSMLTPPVAVASYAAGAIANASLWESGLSGFRLAMAGFILPFVFVFNPALLLQGSIHEIIITTITVIAGSTALAWVLSNWTTPIQWSIQKAAEIIFWLMIVIAVGGSSLYFAPGDYLALVPAAFLLVYYILKKPANRYVGVQSNE